MRTLSAKTVQNLQNMALHGTPGERAAADNLLRQHYAAIQDRSHHVPGGNFTHKKPAPKKQYTGLRYTTDTAQRLAAQKQRQQEAYAQMLAQKQAALDRRPPQHYRPHQPIASAQPSPGEANLSTLIACIFIAFIIYILSK